MAIRIEHGPIGTALQLAQRGGEAQGFLRRQQVQLQAIQIAGQQQAQADRQQELELTRALEYDRMASRERTAQQELAARQAYRGADITIRRAAEQRQREQMDISGKKFDAALKRQQVAQDRAADYLRMAGERREEGRAAAKAKPTPQMAAKRDEIKSLKSELAATSDILRSAKALYGQTFDDKHLRTMQLMADNERKLAVKLQTAEGEYRGMLPQYGAEAAARAPGQAAPTPEAAMAMLQNEVQNWAAWFNQRIPESLTSPEEIRQAVMGSAGPFFAGKEEILDAVVEALVQMRGAR